MEQTHQHEDQTGHYCGYVKPFETVLCDYAGNNHDECSGWAADLDGATAEGRHQKATYDGCDQTHCRAYSTGDTESDGQRKSHNTYYYTCYQVGFETGERVMRKSRDQLRLEINWSGKTHIFVTFCTLETDIPSDGTRFESAKLVKKCENQNPLRYFS